MQTATKHIETEYAKADADFKRIRDAVVKLKTKAEEEAPLTDPEGNDTPLRALLDELPTDANELERAIEDLQYRIDTIVDNPQVLERFEEQSRALQLQKDKLAKLMSSKDVQREELKGLCTPWETKLKNIVTNVNAKFGKYMQELGCAGKF